MGLVVRAYVAPGAAALTTRGSYPTFNYHVTGYGGRLVTVDYRDDGHARSRCAMIAAAKREQPSIVYLANPDNPSGTFVGRQRTRAVSSTRSRANVLVLLDEAYADFVDADAPACRRASTDRIVRTRTFSKAYGMAGARIGYAIATGARHPDAAKDPFALRRESQRADRRARVARRRGRFTPTSSKRPRARAQDYYRIAREFGLHAIESFTNFVCIDCGTADRATRVMNELLARGVWIRKPGAPPLDRYVRVSAGTEPMRRAFEAAFQAVLDEVSA